MRRAAPFAASSRSRRGPDRHRQHGVRSVTKIRARSPPRAGSCATPALIKAAVGDRAPVSVAAQRSRLRERGSERRDRLHHALARLHADPHYAAKLSEGRPEDIVPCIACQTRARTCGGEPPRCRCAVDPASGLERRRHRGRAGAQRRGGSGSLQAARTSSRTGALGRALRAGGLTRGRVRYAARRPRTSPTSLRTWRGSSKLEVENSRPRRRRRSRGRGRRGRRRGHWFSAGGRFFGRLRPARRQLGSRGDAAIVAAGVSSTLHIAERGGIVHVIEPRRRFAASTGAAPVAWRSWRRSASRLHAETNSQTRQAISWSSLQGGGRRLGGDARRRPHLEQHPAGSSRHDRSSRSAWMTPSSPATSSPPGERSAAVIPPARVQQTPREGKWHHSSPPPTRSRSSCAISTPQCAPTSRSTASAWKIFEFNPSSSGGPGAHDGPE